MPAKIPLLRDSKDSPNCFTEIRILWRQKVRNTKTLPSFLASFTMDYVREADNKQRVSEEPKAISKFTDKSNDTLLLTEAQFPNQGLLSFTLHSNSLVNWFALLLHDENRLKHIHGTNSK